MASRRAATARHLPQFGRMLNGTPVPKGPNRPFPAVAATKGGSSGNGKWQRVIVGNSLAPIAQRPTLRLPLFCVSCPRSEEVADEALSVDAGVARTSFRSP